MTEEERIKQIARRFGDALHDRLVEEGIETGMATMYANFLENGVARGLEWAIKEAEAYLNEHLNWYEVIDKEKFINDFKKAITR